MGSSVFALQVRDATTTNMMLLVILKSYRNIVPVPRHWCQKFLQVVNLIKRIGMG